LRERGSDPRCIVRWVAESAGIEPVERVTARECILEFDMERVPKTEVVLAAHVLAEFARSRASAT
jgi:hypothetical protein